MEEKIESRNLLIEILILLPPKSIFRFICVSRRWRNVITDPFFLQRYGSAVPVGPGRLRAFFRRTTLSHSNTQPCPPSDSGLSLAFFQRTTVIEHCNTLRLAFPDHEIIKQIPKNLGYFSNSSNGLILCSREETLAVYHVMNPITGERDSPPPPDSHAISVSAFDDLLWFGLAEWWGDTGGKTMKFFMLPESGDVSYRRKNIVNSKDWVLMHAIDLDFLYSVADVFTEKIILDAIFCPRNSPMVSVFREGKKVWLYGGHCGGVHNHL